MGIFKRITNLLQARLNEVLDQFDDQKKLADLEKLESEAKDQSDKEATFHTFERLEQDIVGENAVEDKSTAPKTDKLDAEALEEELTKLKQKLKDG